MMKKFAILSAALLMYICCPAYHPVVRNYSKDVYKSGAQNWCIEQGMGGSIWFANSGIMEFDGSEWSVTNTVNRTSARSLKYDEDTGRMYFGATDEFGYMHISNSGRMEYVSLKDSLKISIGEIWAIHKLGDVFWLRENHGMCSFDAGGTEYRNFKGKVSASTVIGDELFIFVHETGALSVRQGKDFSIVDGTQMLKDKRVCSILPYKDGGLLFVTATEGVYHLKNGNLKAFETDFNDRLQKANVYCAATDGRHIAFGTVEDGVYIKDMMTRQSIHINTFSGLQNNTVLSMFFDDNGNLWLGLDKGIDMIALYSPEYRLFGYSNLFGAGYASEIYNSRLWLGTNQGLYTMKYPLESFISDDDLIAIREVKGQVWALLNYDDRLFCCHDKGIYIFKDGKIRQIPMNGAWKLSSLRAWPDYLLGSSYDRMFLLRKHDDDWMFDGWIEGFEEASKAFEEDNDGKIWFSHYIKGLFRLTLDIEGRRITQHEYLSSEDGFPKDWSNIPMKINDEIVFHTTSGFYMYDRYSNTAHPYSQLNSLFMAPPEGTSMFISQEDDIYFSSQNMQALCYSDSSGNRVLDSLSLSALSTRRIQGFEDIRSIGEDRLLVNTEDGFSIIRTDAIKKGKRHNHYNVYIKEIQSKDSVIFASRSIVNGNQEEIKLDYSHNTLKFKVNLPVYDSGNMSRYSFMLENYDTDWSNYSTTDSKEYTKLPHGRYTFRVRAKDKCSTDVSEASIGIIIHAPWYLSKAAISIYIILSVLLCIVTYNLMYRYSVRRARLIALKKEEDIRRRQMKEEFEHKAQDLAASTMNVIRKNEMLLDIDSQLEKVAEHIASDRNKSLKILSKIRHDIRENIQHDDVWQKFEKNFDIVYDDYLKRLGEAFPILTISDKKMCAYLKMDLSSKDIAPLMNITVRSVEMTRYRIRKKLGLSRDVSLTEFLQKF